MDSNNNLQFIFACLSTHSKWLKIIAANPKALSDHFELTVDNYELLKSFVETNSDKLWISAILMEERRWREILPSIKLTAKLIGLELLKQYWQEYLNNFALNQRIPTSPILETKEFLFFLLNKSFDTKWKEIFEYEALKSAVYSMELTEKNILPLQDLNGMKFKLNPSFTSKVFSYSISKVIPTVDEGLLILNEKNCKPEHIGFYKTSTGMIRTIKLNNFTNKLLLSLFNKFEAPTDWINQIGINAVTALQFLQTMVSRDIVFTMEAK